MKKILLVFAIVAASIAATAQETSGGFKFGGGPRVGIVVGDADMAYGAVFGADLQGEYMFSPQASGLITTGYTHFSGKDGIDGTGVIPVLAGFRFYPSSQFFLGAKAGLSFGTTEGSGSAFTYEPQAGYNSNRFQLVLGYNAISEDGFTTSHIGLTGIIKFN